MADEDRFVDLVCEGGGVKGIGLAGAFAAIEQRGFLPKSVAGTSAGAITAALIAAGYTSSELDDILLKVPFASFKDEDWRDRIPLVGRGVSVALELGIYEGTAFERWISELLERKGVTRFGQLADDEAEDPSNRYRLRVIASDVTHRRMLVLPDDAAHLGIEPDEMEIAYAVRMSMSIPVFFEPVIHENKATGAKHVIVDGGMLSNFPVWLFDCHGRDPHWPTFGLMLVEPEPRQALGHRLSNEDDPEIEHGSLIDFAKSLALTMMAAHDRMYLDEATFARTIAIPTLGVGTTEFEITPERVQALYQSGYDAAEKFLDGFDFQKYIATYREAEPPGRQDQIQGTVMQPAPGTP